MFENLTGTSFKDLKFSFRKLFENKQTRYKSGVAAMWLFISKLC